MEIPTLNWFYTLFVSCFIFMVTCFVTGLLSHNRYRKQRRPLSLPPCPWRLPIIGHIHFLKKPLHKCFQTLSFQYGSVFGLQMGNQYAIVVSSPAAIEECFGKNDVVLADRPHMLTSKHLNYDSTTIVASDYNDHWRYVRRMANQELFSTSRLNMFQSLRQKEIKSMIKSLFHLTKQRKQMVEMKSRISTLAFNIVVEIVTGKTYYGEDAEHSNEAKEFQELVRNIFELIATSDLGDLIPFVRLIGFRNLEKKMVKLKKKADEVLQNLINECKTKGAGRLAESMLSNILSLRETGSDSISDQTIKGLMLVLITAGTEPTANTIEWVMSNLLNKPEILKKAQLEIDEQIKPSGRLVNEHDLPKLTYLHAIVKETQRLYPVAPLLAPHYSSSECTIQGFRVPRGTMIFANVWAVQRDPKVWEDPLSFKPERFEEMEKSNNNNNNEAYKLVPFGIGRRSCPGANMAHKVVMLGLASLIQCFEWERIGDEVVDMRESDGLDMCKVVPLEAMCRPRNSMIDVLSNL